MRQLVQDVNKFLKECDRLGKKPALRLNGTSDIQWETIEVDGHENILFRNRFLDFNLDAGVFGAFIQARQHLI